MVIKIKFKKNQLMRLIQKLLVFILCFPLLSFGQKNDTKNWIQLLNGKDLTGWVVKIKGGLLGEDIHNTFRVEDGLLKVSYDDYKNGKIRGLSQLTTNYDIFTIQNVFNQISFLKNDFFVFEFQIQIFCC